MVESVTVNHVVGGSNPSLGAKIYFPTQRVQDSGWKDLDISLYSVMVTHC